MSQFMVSFEIHLKANASGKPKFSGNVKWIDTPPETIEAGKIHVYALRTHDQGNTYYANYAYAYAPAI